MTGSQSTVLWGVIGGLSFLVLAQGFVLVTGESIDLAVLFAVAIVVGLLTVVCSARFQRWL
ncbi:hypothetical protein [Halocatena halophila]|uniref:hypothetical protein n=1 Tax=Halocatena halophila TaxID=2814576 RepID=UPI002ED27B52